MPKRPTPALDDVIGGLRPDLFAWFVTNRQSFEATLAESRRPGWKGIAKALTAAGFVKPNGEPMDAGYVRHLWWKVRHSSPAIQGPILQRHPSPEPARPTLVSSRQFTAAKIKE